MKVISKKFGEGTVISMNETTAIVDFNGEVKNMALRFANLTKEDGSNLYTEPKKVKKVYKSTLPKIDYSKYSDAELLKMQHDLLDELSEAKTEARRDGKTGTR